MLHLRVLCWEASSALEPTLHYLEQKERIRKFEEHTRGPLTLGAGRVLARIVNEMMGLIASDFPTVSTGVSWPTRLW